MPSSSTSEACSIVSIPPRIARLIPSPPWAWAATRRPALMRLVGDRAQFRFAQLCWPGSVLRGEDAAGGADLDHLGAELALPPDLIFQLLGTIADPFLFLVLFQAGGQEGAVAMAAGRAESMAGRDDARADRIAIADGLGEADIVAVARSDVADGGEAGIEHCPCVAYRGHAARSCRYIRARDSRRCRPGCRGGRACRSGQAAGSCRRGRSSSVPAGTVIAASWPIIWIRPSSPIRIAGLAT